MDSEQIPIPWGQRYQPTCPCKQDRCRREAHHQPTVPRLGWEDLRLLGPPGAAGPETWLGEAEVTSLGYHRAPCCPLPSAHASEIGCRVSSVCSWHPCSQYLWAEETRQPVRSGQAREDLSPRMEEGPFSCLSFPCIRVPFPSDDWMSDCSGHSSPGSSVPACRHRGHSPPPRKPHSQYLFMDQQAGGPHEQCLPLRCHSCSQSHSGQVIQAVGSHAHLQG